MTRSYRRAAVATLACLGLAAAATGTTLSPASAAPTPARSVKADFNGDGYADLAVGVPLEDVGPIKDAGSVQILYGRASGIDPAASRVFTQDTPGVQDSAEAGDRFGSSVAVGDFNGDSYADLAVGIPNEDVGSVVDAGAVQVFYGSASGLGVSGNQFLSQATAGSVNPAEAGDHFGWSLAAGDMAGTSQADLAVGVPWEDVGAAKDAGAVHLLRGSATGITTAGNQLVSQNTAGASGTSASGDRFGYALVSADMARDGKADLAVGVPYKNVGRAVDAGGVQILPGSVAGLSTGLDQFITQNTAGVNDVSESGDHFGAALAAADMAGTSKADLAVGIPLENVGKVADAGAIELLRGSTAAVTATADQFISQDSRGAVDKSEKADHFGAALAAANLGGTSKADLAVGVPLENFNGKVDGGAVQVIPGGTSGLNLGSDQLLQQDRRGSNAAVETGDHFGASLASANLVGSSLADLVVGVPLEDVGNAKDGGSVQIFRGAAAGVTVSNDQVFTQSVTGAPSYSESGDRFGSAVSAG